jgi:hypothetical protein
MKLENIRPLINRNELSLEELVQIYVELLPDGICWEAKYIENSNMRKLIHSQSLFWHTILQEDFYPLIKNMDPAQTNDFEKWFDLVSLPDGCIGNFESDIAKRSGIFMRLVKRKLATAEDFQNYFERFGLPYKRIYHLGNSADNEDMLGFPYEFPEWFLSDEQERYVLVLEVYKGLETNKTLICLLKRYLPKNRPLLVIEINETYQP